MVSLPWHVRLVPTADVTSALLTREAGHGGERTAGSLHKNDLVHLNRQGICREPIRRPYGRGSKRANRIARPS